MNEVKFYDSIDDALLEYAVIIAKSQNKWVFCKHKSRNTYEFPGGHREANESILDTAKRELYEETGAIQFDIEQVCVYSVKNDFKISYGMLYQANIIEFEKDLNYEIEKIIMEEKVIKENWTYPLIQPKLLNEYEKRKKKSKKNI